MAVPSKFLALELRDEDQVVGGVGLLDELIARIVAARRAGLVNSRYLEYVHGLVESIRPCRHGGGRYSLRKRSSTHRPARPSRQPSSRRRRSCSRKRRLCSSGRPWNSTWQ